MPNSAQAARTLRSGQPSLSRCGGEVTAMALTPATCAGTTFITTLDGYSASPPGTYSPTRRTGTQRWVTVPPGAIWLTFSTGNWAEWPTLALAIDSVSAALTCGVTTSRAAAITVAGTRSDDGRTPSKR